MAHPPWHLRHIRAFLYVAFVISAVGVAMVGGMDDPQRPWVPARQLFGLWALGLLLTAMLIGPLTSVLRPFPLRGHLVLGRRAIGVACFFFASLHAMSYTVTELSLNGVDVFTSNALAEGTGWIVGLFIGAAMLTMLGALAITSFDRMVTKVGPKRWKTIHSAVYLILPLALVHAILLGVDFGWHKARDVSAEPDIGALIGMSSVALVWLVLFVLRRQGTTKDIGPWLARFGKAEKTG